jgi:oligosaccharide repeat unit polymerase
MIKNKIYFINIFLLIILSFLFFVIPPGANETLIWLCLIIFYVQFFNSIRKSISIAHGIKTFIKIDTFFFLFFYIIYYYSYQLYVLGLKSLDHEKLSPYLEYTNKSIIMTTIGLLAFQLGFHYYKSHNGVKVFHEISKKYMRVLSLITMFFIALILLLFAKTGMTTLFAGAYVGSAMGTVTYDAIFTLVTFFIILGILQAITYYSIFKKINIQVFIISIISISWAVALLFVGDRNTFFLVGLVMFTGFFTYIKSISRKQILIFLFGALFLYQVIEISRTVESKDLTSFVDAFFTTIDEQDSEFDKDSSFDITTTGVRATFKVMEEKNYYYGKFKLVSLASIIPYSSRLFVDPNDSYTGSSNVLKAEMIGLNKGWGVGTNIISDCFMDYGLMGVIVIMFCFGKFGGYVKLKTQKHINSPKWIFLYIITLTYYSEISRYGFDFPLRSIVWTYLLFFIINKVMGLNRKNSYYHLE